MYTYVFIDVYTYIHTNKGLVSKYMYRAIGVIVFLRWSIKFCVFFATCIDAHRSNIVFIYMTVTNWVLMSSFLLYCTVPTDRV